MKRAVPVFQIPGDPDVFLRWRKKVKKMNDRKNRGILRRMAAAFLAAAVVLPGVSGIAAPSQQVSAAEAEYEIYPKPQNISYEGDSYIIKNEVNVVFENGIDQAAKDRLTEALELKEDIVFSESDAIAEGKTNVLVGIDGSEEYVDNYVDGQIGVTTDGLFDKTDSYLLDSSSDVITVLGADTDAAFYGLTTLYHILKQMDSYTIRSFHIEDWADVASRGFIEGYYGNPWSTQDRINLMEWGGYYKLNSYFYAPKNDPKHNSQWRQLYTEDELDTLIRPLAEAGNESKCRFVYALHTFMYNPVRFDSNYEADLAAVQAKFEQVIEAGVRQVAILADDAANVGAENYTRFLTDMTEWLAQMKEKYPDLKQTLPFCTQEYMGNGQSYYQNFPENVQIVMTGGKIWGEVSNSFTETFTSNAGRGPYMWVNWPCTDNSKNHLIMGGYDLFLHPGVDPAKIQGIVLNPMQQSEPSKVAIFGNACYSWNIWGSEEEADQTWNDSFKYVDHNSAIETEASDALRELSKHMMNQNMDSRVRPIPESEELAPKLTAFTDKLNAEGVTEQEADELIREFQILQEAADTYEAQAGDENLRDQIIYWLDCWDDTTDAAIAYLNAVKAVIAGDNTGIIQYTADGRTAFENSKTHAFWYLDHNEYAEAGVQHIVPFINTLGSWLSTKVQETADPTVLTQTYISNAFTKPSSGTTDNVLDGNDATSVQFRDPNYPKAGDYFGVKFNRPITVDSLRVAMGDKKNHLQYSKFQYLPEGADETDGWVDVKPDTEYVCDREPAVELEETGLGLENVVAVRLVATRGNVYDSFVLIKSFDINKSEETAQAYPVNEVTYENAVLTTDKTDPTKVTDGDITTEFWLKSSAGDRIDKDAAVILDLGSAQPIGSVYVAQDTARSNGGDILGNGIVEYSSDNKDWHTFGDLKTQNEQTVSGSATARYIRVRNEEQKGVWWRISEIAVYPPEEGDPFTMTASGIGTIIGKHPNINDGAKNNKFEYITDGDESTLAWMASEEPDNGNMQPGLGVEISFSREVAMKEISILQEDADKISTLKIEYQSGGEWKELKTVNDAGASVKVAADGATASAIRLTNGGEDTGKWWQLYEVSVTELSAADAEHVYTDMEETDFTASVGEENASLSAGKVTLEPGSYIGIDLKEIRGLASIDADYTGEGVVLQYSDNGKVWNAEKSVSGTTARYIRLVNTSENNADVTITRLEASLISLGEVGELISSDIPVNAAWGDTRNNGKAFDGDMTTETKFGGSAKAGNTAVFSFGQEISVNSIRIYTTDSTEDYIRDAKVQLSADGSKWTDAFEIGDGQTDTVAAQTMADAGAGEADSNYPNVRYYGSDSLNETARYMRLYVTADAPNRSIIINEIVINGGAYISSEDNMAFSGTLEEKGHQPSLMLDRDFNTTYRPSEANGSMTYKVSDGEGIRSFRIIQSGEASKASVTAEMYNEKTGQVVQESMGTLAQAVNEFVVKEGHTLLGITFEWKEKIPDIAEILLLEQEAEPADTEALKELLSKKPEAYESWTTSSKEAYDTLAELAQAVADSTGISKETVDSIIASLKKAEESGALRADKETIASLEKIAADKVDNENSIYTTVSYMTYENVIAKITEALKGVDNLSQTDAEALAADAEAAVNGLAFSARNRELAELETLRYAVILADNFTETSYAALTDAKNEIDDLVKQDKAAESDGGDRVDPQKLIDAREKFRSAMDGLVNVTSLKAAIEKADTVDGTLYTKESYDAYMQAVAAGEALLKSGTKEEVAGAVEKINEKFDELQVKGTLDEMVDAAKEILGGGNDRYTTDSYNALADITAEAEKNMDDESYVEKIQSAINGLVDVTALRSQISAAEKVDKDQFTTSSYKALTDLLGQTDDLLKSGSRSEVDEMASKIESAIRGLVPRAQGVEDYRDGITLKPEKGYTSDSYQAYKAAYEALMNADPSDLSAEEFAKLKADFERAEQSLKAAGSSADKGEAPKDDIPAVQTGDNTNVVPVVIVLIVCAAAVVAVVVIRKKRK